MPVVTGSLWDYIALAFSAFSSATVLPGTSEVALVAFVSRQPDMVWSLLIVATLFNTLGSTVTWWMGYHISRFSDCPWFPVSPEKLERGKNLFARYGMWSLLFAWLPIVGDGLALAAGVLRVPLLPFVLLAGTGKLARYAVLVAGFLSL